jgi:lysophospholipase
VVNKVADSGMELVGTTRNPAPAGATVAPLVSYDGTWLRTAHWRATAGGRKGTVCLFGGRAEFIEKYFETIADLRRRGFAVAAMDWRGQGGSEHKLRNPSKGHVEDFSEYDRDLEHFMTETVLPDCPPPYFGLAHSMGGNILLRAGCRRDCWFDRIVVAAPLLKVVGLPLPAEVVAAIAGAAVFLGLGDVAVPGQRYAHSYLEDFEGNLLTSDARRYSRNREILERAPRLVLGTPTVAWVRAAFAAMKVVNSNDFPAGVHVPALILAAGDDKVVSTKAIEYLGVQLRAGSHLVIAGARHELLQERDSVREQVWAAFDAFVPGSS